MTVVDPYRAAMQAEVEALGAAVMDMLDFGHQPPFDQYVVQCAAERVHVQAALRLAERDGRVVLAHLLCRYLVTLEPRCGRHEDER